MTKKILITGGAKRIGKSIALKLANPSTNIAIHFNKSAKAAEETKQEIEALGAKCFLIQADLSLPDGAAQLAAAAINQLGSLDVLINNASTFTEPNLLIAQKGIKNETLDDWNTALNVNARAPFFLIQKLAPYLEASSDGLIINLLDTSISKPFYSRAAHSVSKTALLVITKLAHHTLHPKVRVNALELSNILPGENMPESEIQKTTWAGTEAVANAIAEIIDTPNIDGLLYKISADRSIESKPLE